MLKDKKIKHINKEVDKNWVQFLKTYYKYWIKYEICFISLRKKEISKYFHWEPIVFANPVLDKIS